MANGADKDEILTLTEIAGYLKVSEKTILRMVQANQFPGVKVSNQWRFVRAVVDDWLSARMQTAPASSLMDVVGTELEVVPLTRLVSARRILLDLEPDDTREILRRLVAPLRRDGRVKAPEEYVDRLQAREEVVSTAIGHGLAIPHVREPESMPVAPPCIVLGVCRQGVDFGALDGELTHVFAMPCAATESGHLRLLARISLLFRGEGVMEGLLAARTKKDVMEILAQADRDLTTVGKGRTADRPGNRNGSGKP